MSTINKMTAYKRKGNDVTILSWEFQTHMKLLFKNFAVKAEIFKFENSISLYLIVNISIWITINADINTKKLKGQKFLQAFHPNNLPFLYETLWN